MSVSWEAQQTVNVLCHRFGSADIGGASLRIEDSSPGAQKLITTYRPMSILLADS